MKKFDELVESTLKMAQNNTNDIPMAGEWGYIDIKGDGFNNELRGFGDIEKLALNLVKKEKLKIMVAYEDPKVKWEQYIIGDIRDLDWFSMRLREYMKKNVLSGVRIGSRKPGMPDNRRIRAQAFKKLADM